MKNVVYYIIKYLGLLRRGYIADYLISYYYDYWSLYRI